jgi:hypothetical protein
VSDDPANEPDFLVNGVRRPRFVMRRGEVQNWRFVNASIFKFLNLALDGHALNLYSFDGNNRGALKTIGPIAPDDTGTRTHCAGRQCLLRRNRRLERMRRGRTRIPTRPSSADSDHERC